MLPLLSTLLRAPDHAASHGNAALCIAECATEPRCLAVRVRTRLSAAQSHPSAINMWSLPQVLAVQPVVPPLLDLAHRGEGQTMKNAAIALGRLASNERCLHMPCPMRREDDKCASYGSLFIGQSSGTQVETEHGRRKAGGAGGR